MKLQRNLGEEIDPESIRSITKRLLEQIGGKIKLESSPGKGSTFSILLPQNAKASHTTMQGLVKT